MSHVLEKETGLVHYHAPPMFDSMTLCGITDWLRSEGARETSAPVTCRPCIAIAEYARTLRPPKRDTLRLARGE